MVAADQGSACCVVEAGCLFGADINSSKGAFVGGATFGMAFDAGGSSTSGGSAFQPGGGAFLLGGSNLSGGGALKFGSNLSGGGAFQFGCGGAFLLGGSNLSGSALPGGKASNNGPALMVSQAVVGKGSRASG